MAKEYVLDGTKIAANASFFANREHAALTKELDQHVTDSWTEAVQYGTLTDGPRLNRDLMFQDIFKEIPEHLRKQRDLFLKTITILGQAVELRDDYTGGHTQRVTRYSTLLAQHLQLLSNALRALDSADTSFMLGQQLLPGHDGAPSNALVQAATSAETRQRAPVAVASSPSGSSTSRV